MPASPAACVCGDIVRTATALWVVTHRHRARLLLCPLDLSPMPRHRADVPLSWAEALHLGCPATTVIRCRPVWHTLADTHRTTDRPTLGRLSPATLRRVLAMQLAELHNRQTEAPHLPAILCQAASGRRLHHPLSMVFS